jgi:Flp pilus assembly protein TadD
MSLLMDALRKADETKKTNTEKGGQTQWQTEDSELSLIEKTIAADNSTEEITAEEFSEEADEQVIPSFLQKNETLEEQSETTSLDWQDSLLPQFDGDETAEIIAPIETTTESTAIDWEEALLPEFKDDTDWEITTNIDPESENITVNWDEEPLLAVDDITNEPVKQAKKTLSFQALVEDTVKMPNQLAVETKQETTQKIPNSIQNTDISKKLSDSSTAKQKERLSFQENPIQDETPPSPSEVSTEMPDNEATQTATAQRLLAAKTTSSKRLYWLYGLLGIILAGMGMGGYYYYTLTTQSGTFLANVPPGGQRAFGNKPALTPPSPPTPHHTTSTVATTALETTPPVKPIASDNPAENTERPTLPAPDDPASTQPVQLSKQPSESSTQATIKKAVTPPPSAILSKPKTISPTETDDVKHTDVPQLRKTAHSDLNAGLMQAYTAFQHGDNITAQTAYTQVLQQDENNRDALLGLAALALRKGYKQQAQQYYHQVLRLYPQDTLAQVGLITTLGHQTPTHESQLKLLLEKSPDAAYIHFSLGNFYARQNRWPEAQQAYFEAYRYDKQQANYAYNLAISLDRINQPGAALSYYQKALQLTVNQPIQFNIQAVRKRVQTLIAHTPSSALANLSFKAD